MNIPDYPQTCELTLALRPQLHPRFQQLESGISEFTFAGLYLFRATHQYRLARLVDDVLVVLGRDGAEPFFMLPFGLPDRPVFDRLLADHGQLKAASEAQAQALKVQGYHVDGDRANDDYLYARADLAELPGRKFHKKRNHVRNFANEFDIATSPLTTDRAGDALRVLETWCAERGDPADHDAAREAIERQEQLQLCGWIYYVDDEPRAYTQGEENARGRSFLIHFEKAVRVQKFRGIYQFVNQSFASILPEKYETINREQDLGDPGLRRAKKSYHPIGYVRKFRVTAGPTQ